MATISRQQKLFLKKITNYWTVIFIKAIVTVLTYSSYSSWTMFKFKIDMCNNWNILSKLNYSNVWFNCSNIVPAVLFTDVLHSNIYACSSNYSPVCFLTSCIILKSSIYMSQLLRVEPSARASSLPANGWRPASRGRPGATHVVVTFIPFLLWAGSTHRNRKGGSCSVLYSDPLRAIGTPVPYKTRDGARQYGGSPK